MAHYKSMYDDSEFLYAHDLQGKDWTMKIVRCTAGEVTGDKGRKSKKPVLCFEGATKKLALNKSNGKTIARLYGNDTDKWAGQLVTLFPTTTEFGGETVDCIRIRPTVPKAPAAKGGTDGAR